MKYVKIPKSYKVGGTEISVNCVERCEDNTLGNCFIGAGRVEIAELVNKDDKVSEDNKVNTFYHELTHSILDTMGYSELSRDEKFVCCFAGFLTEAMADAYFEEK